MRTCLSAATATPPHRSADGKGPHFWLPFVSNWTGGNSGYVRPAYGDGSFAWYQLPEIKPPEGCKKQQLCNAFKDMVRMRMAWRMTREAAVIAACSHSRLAALSRAGGLPHQVDAAVRLQLPPLQAAVALPDSPQLLATLPATKPGRADLPQRTGLP